MEVAKYRAKNIKELRKDFPSFVKVIKRMKIIKIKLTPRTYRIGVRLIDWKSNILRENLKIGKVYYTLYDSRTQAKKDGFEVV